MFFDKNSSSNIQPQSMAMKLIEQIGFDDACIVIYGILYTLFQDNSVMVIHKKVAQFVREEFDAAVGGDDFARNFVKTKCPDSSWYKGAMNEQAEFPIDQAGGPQQTLLAITAQMMQDDDVLAVKMRCTVVGFFYDAYKAAELNMKYQNRVPLTEAGIVMEVGERNKRINVLYANPKVREILGIRG